MFDRAPVLILRCGGTYAALPLGNVAEVFRPLPVEAVAGGPEAVRGLAIVRGQATPVLDLRRLLGDDTSSEPQRWVRLDLDGRSVVLAVDAVLELRLLAPELWTQLPPLLDDGHSLVAAVASLDAHLLLALKAARLLPALEGWAA